MSPHSSGNVSTVQLSAIRADRDLQPRAVLSKETIAEYSALLEADREFDLPPVVIFKDSQGINWLSEGFHRHEAYIAAGRETIPADVRTGSRRDAQKHGLSSNATHGLRRTNADKRRAVEIALADEEWGKWADRRIGRLCAVHHDLVASVRSLLADSASKTTERKYTTKHGTEATMKTDRIGKSPKTAQDEPKPQNRPKPQQTPPNAADDDLDGLLAILEMTCSPLPPKALTTVRRLLKQVREIVNKQPQVNLSALNEGMEQLHTLFVRHRDKQHVDPSDILRVHKTLRSVSPGVNGTAKR